MLDQTMPPALAPATAGTTCCRIGQFVAKGGCFALRESGGRSVWLEIDPIPLHLLDEEVEITGREYGADLIWVQAIGPAPR